MIIYVYRWIVFMCVCARSAHWQNKCVFGFIFANTDTRYSCALHSDIVLWSVAQFVCATINANSKAVCMHNDKLLLISIWSLPCTFQLHTRQRLIYPSAYPLILVRLNSGTHCERDRHLQCVFSAHGTRFFRNAYTLAHTISSKVS